MRKIAFLVANDTFPEDPTIPSLLFPQNDATDLAEILGDKESCGFEPHVHVNEPSYKVLEDLYCISDQLTQDDTLLFYYSGHGMRHKNELFLVSRNTKLSKLMPTAVKASEVLGYLRDSYCKRRILILDCCYSGVIGLQYKAADTESSLDALANDNGTCILTASTSIQLSEEREKDGHGLFTKALIDCLREPRKETINVDDWYLYALDQLRVSGQKPTKCGYVEGHPIEIGNFRKRFAWGRQLERERLERERQLERERLERERQLERERLIATARTRLGGYVALGELTEEQVEEAVTLLKRDEARLFPRDRRYRDDLVRFSKGEASFLEVFGAGHILRPEPAPQPPENEVSPPIMPPEAPAVDAPLTLFEPPAIDQPVTPPEPAVVDQFITASEPAAIEQPVSLAVPPVVDQPIALPEHEAPPQLTGNGGAGEGATWKPPAQEPKPISSTGTLFGVGLALAFTLLGVLFYLIDSRKKAELSLPQPIATSNVTSAEPSPSRGARPGSEFTDCANVCPAMIVVPAGKFLMGSPETEPGRSADEGPQREVRIAKPFAVSKYAVTFAEWDTCVAAAACPQVKDQWGRGQMPVINVSWDEAKQYVGWLSRLTGKDYRLLTEAEWEYAARAGTQTRYSWGDDPGKGNANCDGCGSKWDGKQTAPVGSFKPNAFGLYDMHGNVWEWVEDVWHDNYKGAPTDGSAWLQGGDTSRRAFRGGSWYLDPQFLRAAVRDGFTSVNRLSYLGFRVARTLTP